MASYTKFCSKLWWNMLDSLQWVQGDDTKMLSVLHAWLCVCVHVRMVFDPLTSRIVSCAYVHGAGSMRKRIWSFCPLPSMLGAPKKKNEQELQKCEIENLSKWHAAGGSPQERQALQNCLHWAHDQTNAKSKNFTQSTNVSSICLLNDSLKILLFAAISNQNVESKAGVSLGVNARSTWWPAQLPRSAVAYVVDTLIGKNLRSKILKTATLFMIAPKIAQCYMFVLPQKRIIRCTNLSPQHGTVYTLPCHSLLYLTNVSLHHSNDMPNCKN